MKTTTKINILLMGNNPATMQALHTSLSTLDITYSMLSIQDTDALFNLMEKTPRRRPVILFIDASGHKCLEQIKAIRSASSCDDLTLAVYDPSGIFVDEEVFVMGANIYIHKQKDMQQLRESLKKVISVNWHYYASSLNRETFFYYA